MAAVVGDYGADHSRFHVIGSSRRNHEHEPSYQNSESRSRPRESSASQGPRSPESPSRPSGGSSSRRQRDVTAGTVTTAPADSAKPGSPSVAASRLPTPPDSSSSNPASSSVTAQNVDGNITTDSMSTQIQTAAPAASTVQSSGPQDPHDVQGQTIIVRDLAHVESLARTDILNGGNRPGGLQDTPLQAMKYEISSMPIGDIIEMVAALLTKITTTNDLQHDALHRNAAHQQTAASHNNDGSSMSPLSSSVLAFHGKNVPAITILSYLSRIHKYCPTTYEVFLSLLVYFDRMTERVNNMVMQAEQGRRESKGLSGQNQSTAPPAMRESKAEMQDKSSAAEDDDDETDSDLADDDDDNDEDNQSTEGKKSTKQPAPSKTAAPSLATYFVVDSFNIHRLIIAGVTCASKFFSDVFYTNSRYAKVGGLPLAELNHLELQFLVLNDFRLSVPVEDLEAYATMLVEFYAREVVGQRIADANEGIE